MYFATLGSKLAQNCHPGAQRASKPQKSHTLLGTILGENGGRKSTSKKGAKSEGKCVPRGAQNRSKISPRATQMAPEGDPEGRSRRMWKKTRFAEPLGQRK